MIKKVVTTVLLAGMIVTSGILPSYTPVASAAQNVVVKSDYANHWAKGTIDWVIQNKLLWLYPDGTFRPDATVTQAQFVSGLVSLFHYKDQVAIPELNGHWAKTVYEKAKKAGVLQGVTIDPNKPLTRGDMALLVINSWKPYYDYAREPFGYTPSDKVLVNRLMTPYPDKKFHEEAAASRALASSVYYHLDNILKGYAEGEKIAQQFHNSLKITNGYLTGTVPTVEKKKKRIDVSITYKNGSYEFFDSSASMKVKVSEIKDMQIIVVSYDLKRNICVYDYLTLPSLTRVKVKW